MNITVREVTTDHVPVLTEIIKKSFHNVAKKFNLTKENAPKHPSNCQEDWIYSALEKGVKYYLLEFEDTPIGCVALEFANTEICYLERLAVLPSFRAKGYGTILVKYLINKAIEAKQRRIEIGIIANDVKLRKWYEKLDFHIKNKAKFNHLPFEVIFMFLDLD